jgi:hypothetical protein
MFNKKDILNLKKYSIYLIIIYIFNILIKLLSDIFQISFLNIIYCDNDNDNENNNDENSSSNPDNNNKKENKITTDDNKNIEFHHHTHIQVETAIKTAAKTIEKSVSQGLGQIGLSGSIVGGMGIGAKVSSGQSLAVKTAMITGGGLVGGGLQVGYSAANRLLAEAQVIENNLNNTPPTETPPSPSDTSIFNNFYHNSTLDDTTSNYVEMLLSSILLLNVGNLIFTIVLFFTFVSKIILSLNYKLT